MAKGFLVAGLGEILWDCFPDKQRLGGAPANFACHVNQLGVPAFPVSCLGADTLGRKAKEELASGGVGSQFLFDSEMHPTGTVEVSLDSNAKPTFSITENVAWDHLTQTDTMLDFATKVDATCFGTLAQRSQVSRSTIQNFLKATPSDSLRILDVNLRGEYYSEELIVDSLELANVLKLSDEELPVLATYFGLQGDAEQQLKQLIDKFDLRLIAYTLGLEGSMLATPDQIDIGKATPVEVVDSVGAGDSFTAALVVGMLHGLSLRRCNEIANRVAAFVCSSHGACPELPVELLQMVPCYAGE